MMLGINQSKEKDIDIFNKLIQKEDNLENDSQSKKFLELFIHNENKIQRLEKEVNKIKSQLLEIALKISFINLNNNNSQRQKDKSGTNIEYESFNKLEENNKKDILYQILQFKDDIKNDLLKNINEKILEECNKNFKKYYNLSNNSNINNNNLVNNNNKNCFDDSNKYQNLTERIYLKEKQKKIFGFNYDIPKNNCNNNNNNNDINNNCKINNNNMNGNNINDENVIERLNNFDLDFDRLVNSLKKQFCTTSRSINLLEKNKVNKLEYEINMNNLNKTFKDLESKIEKVSIKENNENINRIEKKEKDKEKTILNKNKNNMIFNSENNYNNKNTTTEGINSSMNNSTNTNNNNSNCLYMTEKDIQEKLNEFKNIIYQDFEKVNLKILKELKSQAGDIKFLYQNIQTIEESTADNNKYSTDNSIELFLKKNDNNIQKLSKSISLLKKDLEKKANLDQINFALDAQTKINEVFSSSCRVARFCWDSEGDLVDKKFIKWSIQNINTSLDVFKWEQNKESIKILQNGVYKLVVGLVGDTKKNIGIVIENDKNKRENIIIDTKDYCLIDNNYDYKKNCDKCCNCSNSINFNSFNSNSNICKNKNNILLGSWNGKNINNIGEQSCYNNIFNYLKKCNFDIDKGNVKYIEKYLAFMENTLIKVILIGNNDNENTEEAFIEIIKII